MPISVCFFKIVTKFFYSKSYTPYDELGRIRGKVSESVIFERVITYFYPKSYKRTTSLVEYGEIPKILIFERAITYFYPQQYSHIASLVEYGGNLRKLAFQKFEK